MKKHFRHKKNIYKGGEWEGAAQTPEIRRPMRTEWNGRGCVHKMTRSSGQGSDYSRPCVHIKDAWKASEGF